MRNRPDEIKAQQIEAFLKSFEHNPLLKKMLGPLILKDNVEKNFKNIGDLLFEKALENSENFKIIVESVAANPFFSPEAIQFCRLANVNVIDEILHIEEAKMAAIDELDALEIARLNLQLANLEAEAKKVQQLEDVVLDEEEEEEEAEQQQEIYHQQLEEEKLEAAQKIEFAHQIQLITALVELYNQSPELRAILDTPLKLGDDITEYYDDVKQLILEKALTNEDNAKFILSNEVLRDFLTKDEIELVQTPLDERLQRVLDAAKREYSSQPVEDKSTVESKSIEQNTDTEEIAKLEAEIKALRQEQASSSTAKIIFTAAGAYVAPEAKSNLSQENNSDGPAPDSSKLPKPGGKT